MKKAAYPCHLRVPKVRRNQKKLHSPCYLVWVTPLPFFGVAVRFVPARNWLATMFPATCHRFGGAFALRAHCALF